MLDEQKIIDAIKTAIGEDGMAVVVEECKKHPCTEKSCNKCRFRRPNPNGGNCGCIFELCPLDWGE